MDPRGLQPIVTEGCSWMGWCSTGRFPMHTSVDIGLRICIGQVALDYPVRRDVITYLTAFANIDIDYDPLATKV